MNAQLIDLFKQYGSDPIAYTGLQAGMHHFQTSFGYIAYASVGKSHICLGPPVCAKEDIASMLAQFLQFSPQATFCYVPEEVQRLLVREGYYGAAMGVDRMANISQLLQTPGKELNSANKKAVKRGFYLAPLDIQNQSHENTLELEAINAEYFARSQCHFELKFLNRPMGQGEDGLRCHFALHKHDEEHSGQFGYVALNPYYLSGTLKGYLLDIIRFKNTRMWGVWLASVAAIAAYLQPKGLQLSLGFCILKDIQDHPGNSPWLDRQVRWAQRLLSASQYVNQLSYLKTRIPGTDQARYFCSRRASMLGPFYCLLRASGLKPTYLFGPELFYSIRQGLRKNLRGDYASR